MARIQWLANRKHNRKNLIQRQKSQEPPPKSRQSSQGIVPNIPISCSKLAYSVKEAAAAIGVSEWYIREEIKLGKLGFCGTRGRIIIPVWELIRYLGENMRTNLHFNVDRWT